ncbi:hyalin-like [Aplysia californica]|uniref:Hyalin-like n=1 Tax=Aplysia californica TaxID=6500 RepID=A0ABM1VZI1_APLCA|nr:hyalin-like [Aplysia californica]
MDLEFCLSPSAVEYILDNMGSPNSRAGDRSKAVGYTMAMTMESESQPEMDEDFHDEDREDVVMETDRPPYYQKQFPHPRHPGAPSFKGVKSTSEGDQTSVESGTACLAPKKGGNTVYRCQAGAWTVLHLMDEKETRGKRNTQSTALHRRKRWFWGWVLGWWKRCKLRCSGGWWWRRCRWVCFSSGRPNRRPTITCPAIPNYTLAKGRTDIFVSWSPATAHDPEDGTIRTSQTVGPYSNSWVGEGTHTVTYQATDRKGSSSHCSEVFRVIVKKCSTYMTHGLSNGQVSCSNNNVLGSICTYSCNSGYQLTGPSSSECQDNQHWSYRTRPECIEIVCPSPPSVDHGKFEPCDKTSTGSKCPLSCDSGYVVEGNADVECKSDKKWTSPGRCKDVDPPDFTCPAVISLYSEPKKQPKQVTWTVPVASDNSGETVVVSSDHQSGDEFPVGDTIVTFSSTDSSGNEYTCETPVTVKVKYCDVLPAPDFGSVSCSHGSAVGSDCSISCSQGFQLSGVAQRTCLDSRTWSDAQSFCKRGRCGQTPSVDRGNFDCPNGDEYEDICTLRCDSGYQANKPVAVSCQVTLLWTQPGNCTDVEPPSFTSGCPGIMRYAEALNTDTYVHYTLPQAADNSNEAVVVVGDPAPGSRFDIGLTNVSVTTKDTSGNVGTCTFPVTVNRE